MGKPVSIPEHVGDLMVLQRTSHGYVGYFDCRCSCGKKVRVWWRKLVAGRVTSCGCTRTPELPNKVYAQSAKEV